MNGTIEGLSQTWLNIQGTLFPWLQEELGELTEKQQQLNLSFPDKCVWTLLQG